MYGGTGFRTVRSMTTDAARALLRRVGQFMDGFSGCFSRQPQREAASRYLAGLFNDSGRKSIQAMHGWLSDDRTDESLQHFITDSPWEGDPRVGPSPDPGAVPDGAAGA